MKTGVKVALGSAAVFAVAVGGELLYLHHRNAVDQAGPAPVAAYKGDPDDDVFLKREHPNSLKEEKDLKGRTLWVSAGGQMDYYPYNGHAADYGHSQGTLLGAEKIVVKDAVEQKAPKSAAFRIPQGDKQVLLVFTKGDSAKEYAVPVGTVEKGTYNLVTDEIFFYDDPHTLFSYWPAPVWAAIEEHKAIPGMNERQVMMALGQVSTPHGDKAGDRMVEYDDQGKPKMVTFVGGKATTVAEEKQ